jgi:hypothetical protein
MNIRAILILLLSLCTAFSQGTVVFHNRSLTDPATGAIYNAPFMTFCPGDTAQLYMVTGTGAASIYTPLFPTQTFRDPPNNGFLTEPVLVAVPGAPAGTIGVRVAGSSLERPGFLRQLYVPWPIKRNHSRPARWNPGLRSTHHPTNP